MRGPVGGIPDLLQPVAHTLLQAKEEINQLMQDFPESLLWARPAGLASPAFHLKHAAGVLDRLFTYARSQPLSPEQLKTFYEEEKDDRGLGLALLVERFNRQIDLSLAQLAITEEKSLTAFRGVGRQLLPSTVMGLMFHAAEHLMRHTGQLLVTKKILIAHRAATP
ncbi:MAG TPA: DinB family protein [Puia sp.]|nr:DinB family protein [Puia sp.]